MNDTAPVSTSGATPWHFWAVGIVSLLWNAFGGYDYSMTRMRNLHYLSMAGDPQEILAWIDSFPMWAQVLWPIGVWSSVLGSVLLLLRSRHAATAFLVSLVGAIGSFASQMTHAMPASLDTTANKLMPFVILAVILFLWWYARQAKAQGILK